MKLSELLVVLNEYKPMATDSTEVLGLSADTRLIRPGFVFVAVSGHHRDAHDLISEARERGAIFVVGDRDGFSLDLKVENSRESLNQLARQFYHQPSKEMFCFGVTGTNGKTSSTYLIEHILDAAQIPVGVLGTINHHLGKKIWETQHTTPEPVELQSRLREMKEAGAKVIAMEVSSHALDQHRADGVDFNTVIFTNLTRDHLDYHKSMEDYFFAKQRLFQDLLWKTSKIPPFAVVNVDDPWGRKLRIGGSAGLWTFGQTDSDFQFRILKLDFAKTDFELKTPYGKWKASVPLCGLHNVYNAVGVIAALTTILMPPQKSIQLLESFKGIPGRMQFVNNSKNLNIFVDYAHTPDALENVLKTLNEVRTQSQSSSKIWTVMGCGGDRDRGKRPLMAQVAQKFSDDVMITSDNPRTEDPEMILNEIEAGFDQNRRWDRQVDRRKAIAEVLQKAKPQDVVLIAGKGHEDYQILGTEKVFFSDVQAVQEILK